MEFHDIEIECKSCNRNFTWTKGEQEFYHDRSLQQPKKCPSCRAHLRRKIHRQDEESRVREEAQHGL